MVGCSIHPGITVKKCKSEQGCRTLLQTLGTFDPIRDTSETADTHWSYQFASMQAELPYYCIGRSLPRM